MTELYLVLLLAAAVADVWTTNKVISQGGIELNPVIAKLMSIVGMKAWGPIKTVFTLGVGVALTHLGYSPAVLILAGITGFIAYRNYTLIDK